MLVDMLNTAKSLPCEMWVFSFRLFVNQFDSRSSHLHYLFLLFLPEPVLSLLFHLQSLSFEASSFSRTQEQVYSIAMYRHSMYLNLVTAFHLII